MLKLVGETETHYDIEEYDNEDITVATIKRHLISKADLKALFEVLNISLSDLISKQEVLDKLQKHIENVADNLESTTEVNSFIGGMISAKEFIECNIKPIKTV